MTTKKNKPKTKKRNKWIGRLIFLFWFCLIVGILSVAGIIYGTSQGMLGELPDIKELENPEINVASEIISADGIVIDRYEKEKTIPITYDDLPEHLILALKAREDERYDEHSGIDGRAILRAVFKGGTDGGGSTITQQLAKQLFTGERAKNKIEAVKQKLKEWVVSAQLEKRYTKEEIITMYLNKFDFIYRASGIEAAAQTYFKKRAKDLTLSESATLIAMLKSPVIYNPKMHPEAAKHERNVVLTQMLNIDYITQQEYDAIKDQPIKLNFEMLKSSVTESHSAYFKYAMRKELEQYFDAYEKKYGVKYDLYRDGLKIYTSIDSRMQKMGEEAMKKHLKRLQKMFFSHQKGRRNAPFYGISQAKAERIFEASMRRTIVYKNMKSKGLSEDSIISFFKTPKDSIQIFTWNGPKYEKNKSLMDSIRYHKHIFQSGMMSMNPTNGTIRAWVGGIDWDYFKYDHVKQAKRQVGSTFKPFVYATAIHQMNYTPCHKVSNARFKAGSWRPKNSGGGYGGFLTLRQALAKSVNIVTARLIAESGPENVIHLARDLGVESPIPKNLTIGLGSASLTVYEMVGAYSAFANKGIYIKPEIVLTIEDKNGKIIKDYEPITREVLNEDVAYTMIDLMKGVVNFGTAKRLRGYGIHSEVAGKTGTTNDNSDGWFIGVTPNLVTGIWVGCEDRFAHFRSTAYGQGAYMALPIWAYYMKSVYAKGKELGVKPSDKFEKPDGIDERWDCSSLQGFYNYGDVGSIYNVDTSPTHVKKEQSVNEMLTQDNDTLSFE